MNAKETPRQKMISLMYLVLICMLALNVSREVLQGFVNINESIETTNSNFTGNTKKILDAIDEAINQGHHEFVPYYAKAKEVSKLTQATFNYVDTLKKQIIKYTEDKEGADTLKLGAVENLDNYDKPTFFLLGDDETQPRTGQLSAKELRLNLRAYADSLNTLLDQMKNKAGLKLPEKDYQVLKGKLQLFTPRDNFKDKDGKTLSWEMKNFYELPLAAIITNLSKIQGDLRNIEGEMINTFASAPGKLAVKFNQMQARIVPESKYIQAGSPFTADVFLSAASTDFKEDNLQFIMGNVDTATGKVAGDAVILPIENGTGKINFPTNAVGNREINGWVKFRDGLGNYKYFKYKSDYTVANAAVAVSADNMNALYSGIGNPITISAAGVAPHDLVADIDGCDGKLISLGNGKYVASVKGSGKCSITVYKKTEQGLAKQGLAQVFRVKKIPNPTLKVNSKAVISTADFTRDEARNINYVSIDNTGFDFNVPFEMISFQISFAGPRVPYQEFSCNGNKLSEPARRALSTMNKGGKIYIEDIKIKAPDGPRALPTVKINVK